MPRNTKPTEAPEPRWCKLTWDGLTVWAGSKTVERGRGYQRSGQVKDLRLDGADTLLAWVQGTERYATTVTLSPGLTDGLQLKSRCTCPVGLTCKHAVAVVLEYLEALKKNEPVKGAAESDRRRGLLEEKGEDWEEDEEDYDGDDEEYEDDDYGDEDDEEEEAYTPPPPRSAAGARAGAGQRPRAGQKAATLRAYLESLGPSGLSDLVLDLAERYPEVHEDLNDRAALRSGKTTELIGQARKEIARVTAEEAWYNSWDGQGSIPDYGGVKRRLEQLLEAGHADAVLDLGKELLGRAATQVEESHDEGETASEVAACMRIVFRAVPQAGCPGPAKILYAIDLVLQDGYDLCHGSEEVLEAEWPEADWSAVADELRRRLEGTEKPKSQDDFFSLHRRDRLSGWLIHALESAGRDDEALAVCETEARVTGSYERLVRRLIERGRVEDAERWIREGIAETRDRWAGIAKSLQELWRGLAERRKDWPTVAALDAEEFFDRPSIAGLQKVEKSAAKAGHGPGVRAAALQFLETGLRPVAAPSPPTAPRRGRAGKERSAPAGWPLPDILPPKSAESGHARRRHGIPENPPTPHYDVLLELAIKEQRADDVLAWYDRMTAKRGGHYLDLHAQSVAEAVGEAHPERALAIFRKLAESEIAHTSPSAYERALSPLRKMRALLHKLKRKEEWARYLAKLRTDHQRKRRLLESLDRLEGRPIVEG